MRKRTTCHITCDYCHKLFIRSKDYKVFEKSYCSRNCMYKAHDKRKYINCGFCNTVFLTEDKNIRKSKSGFVFCTRSCAAKYNNQFKIKSNRSKIEIKFGEELQKLFPKLEFIFNDKIALNGYELDIYIPELKLAIEWNGIVHYQPIYGQDKLKNTQYKDYQKQLLCQKLNIDLIVICDMTSKQRVLNESITKISKIIEFKLGGIQKSNLPKE